MKQVRSDGQMLKRGSLFQLVQLHGQWHVVGRGYRCMVDGYDEGVRLIERLRAEVQRHRVSIRPRQDDPHKT